MDSHIFEQMKRGIEFYQRTRNAYKRDADALRRYGGFALSQQEKRGIRYFTAVSKRGGKEKRKYLGKADNRTVRAIQRRYYLNKAVRTIDDNLDAMQRCIDQMKSVDPAVMVQGFPKAYRSDDISLYESNALPDMDGRKWEARQIKGDFIADGKRYRTRRGEMVRSKTELVIANELASRGISYVYEAVRYINNKRRLPDFVIYHNGREIIWEHFGMMNDKNYYEANIDKLLDYLHDGYYPNYNLITTFEEEGRELDSIFISRIIDLWFGDGNRPGALAA